MASAGMLWEKSPLIDAREKRKRGMALSIKLGHCVCNPRTDRPRTGGGGRGGFGGGRGRY